MELFNCACGNEALSISSFDGLIEISIWEKRPERMPFNFKNRLRWCWHILKTGCPWNDSIILDKKEAKRFLKHFSQQLDNC